MTAGIAAKSPRPVANTGPHRCQDQSDHHKFDGEGGAPEQRPHRKVGMRCRGQGFGFHLPALFDPYGFVFWVPRLTQVYLRGRGLAKKNTQIIAIGPACFRLNGKIQCGPDGIRHPCRPAVFGQRHQGHDSLEQCVAVSRHSLVQHQPRTGCLRQCGCHSQLIVKYGRAQIVGFHAPDRKDNPVVLFQGALINAA